MLVAINLPPWGPLTASVIGLTATCAIFLLGRLVLTRRKPTLHLEKRSRAPRGSSSSVHPDQDCPSPERRCHFRRSGNPTPVSIGHAENPCELARGVVVDRSTGGVCVELPTPLAVGAVISLKPSVGTTMGTWVEMEVRHCRRGGSAWRVGLRFVRTPPLSVLWMFG